MEIRKSYGTRESNMELLRMVAMLLVMIVHANFRALHVPTFEEVHTNISSSVLRYFTESISIICVNLFILLSGWYGINFKLSRLRDFLIQVFFFSVFCAVAFYVLHPEGFSLREAISHILLTGQWDYWFVKSYFCLYLFAPVLNMFVKHATKEQFRTFLIAFYIFQTIYAFVFWDGASFLQNGYSALSFMGLYLLARYIRLYPSRIWQLPKWYDMGIYWGMVLGITAMSFVLQWYDLPTGNLYYYSSPMVIVAAVYFLLFFTKIRLQSRVVNWIAGSSFAVYLLHSNPYLASPYYDDIILHWFESCSRGGFLIRTVPFILTVYILAICIDKIRIVLFRLFIKKQG